MPEQKCLDSWTQPPCSPKQKTKTEVLSKSSIITTEKKPLKRVFPLKAPENLPESYFVSATYDGRAKKAVVKLYEPTSGKIYFWYDNTGHKPYCYSNLSPLDINKIDRVINHPGFDRCQIEELFDPITDRKIMVTKIIANDPLAIGGRPHWSIRDIIPEDFPQISENILENEEIKVWEARIKYYQSYIYDTRFLPGMIFRVENGNLIPHISAEAEKTIAHLKSLFTDASEEELEYLGRWAKLTEYPAPQFRRAAIDIEVYAPISNRVPDSRESVYPVICCSLYTSDDQRKERLGVKKSKKAT